MKRVYYRKWGATEWKCRTVWGSEARSVAASLWVEGYQVRVEAHSTTTDGSDSFSTLPCTIKVEPA